MSKLIFDYIRLLDESPLFTLCEALKFFPYKISRASIERYIRNGIRGVTLETILIGGRRLTSEAAIRRFLVNQQNVGPENVQPEASKGNISKKELAEKSKRYRLPE